MANNLMACMALETGRTFRADKANGKGYYGLIQFGDDACSDLKTTTAYIRKLSAVKQLDWVKKYFALRGRHKFIKSFVDLYITILYPEHLRRLGRSAQDNDVLFDYNKKAYLSNPGFFQEPGEKDRVAWVTNKQGKQVKKYLGFQYGSTKVWEVAKVNQQFYDEGLLSKNRNFKSTCANVIQPPIKQVNNNSKWYDPVKNPVCTLYMQSGGGGEGTAGEHWGLFGKTRNGHAHQGLDLFATVGTEVFACVDAEVFATIQHGGYGQTLTLKVKNNEDLANHQRDYNPIYSKKGEIVKDSLFDESKAIYFFYAHLKQVFVKEGDIVTAGQLVALTGTSGVKGGTCAPHLHFEIFSTVYAVGKGLKYRCHPGRYVFFKNVHQMTEADKLLQKNTAKRRH